MDIVKALDLILNQGKQMKRAGESKVLWIKAKDGKLVCRGIDGAEVVWDPNAMNRLLAQDYEPVQ